MAACMFLVLSVYLGQWKNETEEFTGAGMLKRERALMQLFRM